MPITWTQIFTEKSPLDLHPELIDDKHMALLRVAIWVLLIGTGLFLGILLLGPVRVHQWRIYAATALMTLAASAYFTLRYRGAVSTMRLLAIGSWVLTTVVSFVGEGLRTPILISYPVILVFGGWLLGARACLRFFIASSIAVIGLAAGQQTGLIKPVVPVSPPMMAMAFLIMLAISALLTLYLLRLFQDRYAEMRRLNDELQQSLYIGKQREEELRIAATAFESHEAMMITDAQVKILRINQAFTECTGYTAGDVLGQSPTLFKSGRHDLDFYHHMWDSVVATGGWQGEIWNRRKNGDIYPVLLSISAVRDEHGAVTHYIGSHIDITEQKHAEAQIRELNIGLEKRVAERTAELESARNSALAADRAKSDFLASMSHEIRTPLNAILGFSQLINMAPDLPAEAKENAQEIGRAGQHLLVLINEVLDLARIEANHIELTFESVPLETLLADCLAMIKPIADKHGIELHSLDGNGHATVVRADYVRLRQVVINLLSNAIKYNRPGGAVTLACKTLGDTVRISVADSGPGIPEHKQIHLFNAFDRMGKESGTVEGTGIGLVISKRLVEAMGGNIGFKSATGLGSTFWVDLPLSESDVPARPELPTASIAPETNTLQSARHKVLYVEDNATSLRLMQKIIERWPEMELLGAPTAEHGIEQARRELPALILMDINLPGMDGYEALAVLKADPLTAHIPVIALTANAMKNEKDKALTAGFSAFVTKPIDLASLYDTLRQTLDTLDKQMA